AIRHLECVRTGRLGFASLRFIQIGERLPARVHSLRQRSDNLIKVNVSSGLRITEIQLSQACGTSEIPEVTSGVATIIFVVTGKNRCSRSVPEIGIAIGTIIATIGGMATGAASSTDRGSSSISDSIRGGHIGGTTQITTPTARPSTAMTITTPMTPVTTTPAL